MSSHAPATGSTSVRRQRIALLIALVAWIAMVTAGMIALGDSLADRFASQGHSSLEWRALRGAQELARTSELGIATHDAAAFNRALDAYAVAPDLQVIAVASGGQVLTSRGSAAAVAPVFSAKPGTLVRGVGYVASWESAIGKGGELVNIAVLLSTQRLADMQAAQHHTAYLTVLAGIAAAVLGSVAILWLTRRPKAPASPDHLVSDPATPPEAEPEAEAPRSGDQLEALRLEVDERARAMRLILDHAAEGFLMVDLGGPLTGERAAVTDGWFGEPAPDTTLAGYLGPHSLDFVKQFGHALQGITEGVAPLAESLAGMPNRLTAGARTFAVRYAPLMQGDRPERILLVLGDITEQVARELEQQAQKEKRELATLTELIAGNRAEFDEFFAEAAGLVAALDAPSDDEAERRTLRTLRDSCAYYGLDSYVALCQKIEDAMAASSTPMTDEHRVALADGWGRVASQLVRKLA